MATIVLREKIPSDTNGLPVIEQRTSDHEWINLAGIPTANISHPNMEAIIQRQRLEKNGCFEDSVITRVLDCGDSWYVFYDASRHLSEDHLVKIEKSIGVEPKQGEEIRIYRNNPGAFMYSEMLGVALGDMALLFD